MYNYESRFSDIRRSVGDRYYPAYGYFGRYDMYDTERYVEPKPKSNAQLARDQFETRWKK